MIKKTFQKKTLFILAIIFSPSMCSQDDVILKSDGNEMQGKVL